MWCNLLAVLGLAVQLAVPVRADSEKLSDNQISKVLIAINDGEAKAAKAMTTSKNNEVKNYAELMRKEHGHNQETLKKIMKQKRLDPKDSQISKTLETKLNRSAQELNVLKKSKVKNSGSADKLYIEQQIEAHEDALNVINDQLLPNVKENSLRALISDTKKSVENHLARAREIQARL